MSTSVSWPPIGGTTYSVPASGELNWQNLSLFLIAVGNNAQGTQNTKLAIRTATTSPVTVLSASDTVVITALTVPGAVAVTLPAGVSGQAFFIVDGTGDASSNNVTITPAAGLINGSATYIINKNRAGVLIGYNGTGWTVLSEFTNVAAGTIPRSSIATGSPDHVVINSGTGALSSEATLAKSRGGTGADNSSVTFPSSGTIPTNSSSSVFTSKTIDGDDNTVQDLGITSLKTVIGNATKFLSFDAGGAPVASKAVPSGVVLGTTDTQALTNKDYDGGVASNSLRLTIPKNTTAALNALTRKAGTVLYDTDTSQFKGDDGATLSAFSTASTASPTALGNTTSYFPVVQSAVKTVSSANYSVLTTDGFSTVLVTTGASDRTIDLPAVASNLGRIIKIVKVDSGAGGVIIDPNSSETINGATTNKLISQYSHIELVCGATEWNVSSVSDWIIATATGATVSTASYTTAVSITLQPGVWFVSYNFWAAANGSLDAIFSGIATATDTNTGYVNGNNNFELLPNATGQANFSCVVADYKIAITAATTYYLTSRSHGASTTADSRITGRRAA